MLRVLIFCGLLLSVTAAADSGSVLEDKDFDTEDIPDYEVLNFSPEAVAQVRSTKNQTEPSGPCNCKYGKCTCCTGPLLDWFQQKACMDVVYTPEDFAFDLSISMNKRVMYRNRLSGKNPPPACVRIPRLPNIRICAKFSNIYFVGRNMHMCMGFEGLWDYYELFSFSFDCMRFGANGIAVVAPEQGGGILGVDGGVDAIIDAGDDIADYDENVVRSVSLKNVKKSQNITTKNHQNV